MGWSCRAVSWASVGKGGKKFISHFLEYFHDLLDLDVLQQCPPCYRRWPDVGGIGVRVDAGTRKGII